MEARLDDIGLNGEEDFLEASPDETMKIEPSLAKMYEYSVDDQEKKITVVITIPEKFAVHQLQVELHKNHAAIRVEAPGILPIIKGTLLDTVQSMSHKFVDNTLVITIIKQEII